MSAAFDGTTGYISGTAPSWFAYPWWFMCWGKLDSVNTVARSTVGVFDTGSADNYLQGGMNSTEQIRLAAQQGGGSAQVATIGTAVTAALWFFKIGRFFNATNRRLNALQNSGYAHLAASSTASAAPTGLDTFAIGARLISTPDFFWHGFLSHVVIGTGDPLGSSGQTVPEQVVRQLARYGPFAFDEWARNVAFYRSFNSPSLLSWNMDDCYDGLYPPLQLSITGGVTPGPSCPFADEWVSPTAARRKLII